MKKGYFGEFGGSFVSPEIQKELDKIEKQYVERIPKKYQRKRCGRRPSLPRKINSIRRL